MGTAQAAPSPRRPGVRIGLAIALGTIGLLLCVRTVDSIGDDVLVPTSWRAGDTVGLVRGADAAIACAREGTWRGCGLLPSGRLLPDYPEVEGSAVDRFPPLLYLPALVVQGAGGDQALSLRVIAVLGLASFGLLVALPWLIGRRAGGLHRHRHLWALLILASPLLPYAGSTWSEVHSAVLLAVAVALVAADAPPALVALAALGAGLSKDTAPPFVIALACAVALAAAKPHRGRGLRRWIPASPSFLAAVAGSVAALLVTAAFNVFRYDSPTNVTYLAETFQVRRPSAVAGQLVAVLVSPNGGLLPFWPAAGVLVAVAVAGWRTMAASSRAGLVVAAVATFGFLVSLALWWAPFGWQAWSPRLCLPLVPAVAVAVLVLLPADFRPGRPLVLAAAAAVVLAVPQAGITGRSTGIIRFMNAPRPACAPGAAVEADFVRCNLDRAWRQQPGLLVEGLQGVPQPVAAPLTAATLAGGLALVACWAGAAGARRREGYSRTSSRRGRTSSGMSSGGHSRSFTVNEPR